MILDYSLPPVTMNAPAHALPAVKRFSDIYSITPEFSILQNAHATGWRYLVIGCGK